MAKKKAASAQVASPKKTVHKKKPTKPTKRKKQTRLVGHERIVIKELKKLADDFADKRDNWQAWGVDMREAKDKLQACMEEHKDKLEKNQEGAYVYKYDDRVVIFEEATKANVKVAQDDTDE